MYKPATLLCASVFCMITTFAQQSEKFNPEKEKREINDYTIRLVPLPVNTFGFFIMKGNKPVYSQLSDPFSSNALGFKTKEAAYKVAEWVVNENNKNGRPPIAIPASVAKELKLKTGAIQQ